MFFLHGFMGSVEDFDFFPDSFVGLKYVNALGIDVSESPWDEISSYLWNQISDEKISLFGYSMGGRLALAMFAAQPDRVEKLVLCGAQFRPPIDPISRKTVDTERAVFLKERPDAFLKWWSTLDLFGPQDSARWSLVKQKRIARMKNSAPLWSNLLQSLSVSEQADFSALIKANSEKITFIYGENDEKYAAFAEEYEVLGVQTIGIPDAWHAVHLDNPDGLISVLNSIG